MKKPITRSLAFLVLGTLFFALASIPKRAIAQCTTWVPISGDFSTSTLEMQSTAVNSASVPYVAFKDYSHGDKVTVVKSTGSSWTPVGGVGFSSGVIQAVTLKITNGSDVPYVAYVQDGDVYVMRYNGTTWENVGSSLLGGTGSASEVSLALAPDNTPYVALRNSTDLYTGAQVYKYNGSAWETVGGTELTPGDSWNLSVAVNPVTNAPYLAFLDGYVSGVSVMKFDGTSWEFVGGEGFTSAGLELGSIAFNSAGAVYVPYKSYDPITYDYLVKVSKFASGAWSDVGDGIAADGQPSIAIGAGDVPYVLYAENDGDQPTVRKYNGTSWEQVGDAKFSPSFIYSSSLTMDATGVPYVSYLEYYSPGLAVVKKLDTFTMSITGPTVICTGNTISLTGSPSGGEWISSDLAVASPVDASGTFYNNGRGTSMLTYTLGACTINTTLTNPHTPTGIGGPSMLKVGETATFSDAVSGGTWNVGSGSAVISSAGVFTGLSEAPVLVSYSTSAVCGTAIETKKVFLYENPARCGSWGTVGTLFFSDSTSGYIGSAIDPSGHPYVAYSDMAYGFRTMVKRFNGSAWVTVGAGPLPSVDQTQYNSIVIDASGTPYVCYTDYYDSHKMHVQRFNGSSWEEIGDIDAYSNQPKIALDGAGNLYACYLDNEHSYRGTVKKWTGSSWVTLGSAGFTAGAAPSPTLGFYGSTVYLAYRAHDYSGAATVMKYNGTSWEFVGAPGFSGTSGLNDLDMAISSAGQPYVVYSNNINNNKCTVMTYDGTSWVPVGSSVLSDTSTYINSIAVAPDGSVLVNYTEYGSSLVNHVKKYNGSSWSYLGGSDNLTGAYYGVTQSMALDTAGNPYVFFTDTLGWRLSVKRYYQPLSASITGTTSVCAGGSTTMACAATGGTWSSGNETVATVGSSSGIVSGVSAGTSVISYMTGGCSISIVVTVTPSGSIGAISGTATLYPGGTTTLVDITTGGSWSSSDPGVATIGSSTGVVTGVSPGTTVMSYTVPGTCGSIVATQVVTVNLLPITGSLSISGAGITTLSSTIPGGTWSTGCSDIATVTADGVVTGVSNGLATVTYAVGSGYTTAVITVNMTSSLITGTLSTCVGAGTTLSHPVSGGAWSSSNISSATVSIGGVVTGVTVGTAKITYAYGSGCSSITTVTVNASSSIGAISGTATLCTGGTTTLSNTTSGGTWTSNNPSVATVGSSTGIVSGIGSGNATITYNVSGACGTATATKVVTVGATSSISGTLTLCVGVTSTLSGSVSGGAWGSNNAAVATIGATSGVLTAVGTGTANVTYSLGAGCVATAVVTVSMPASMSGTFNACVGQTATLTDATTGGAWSSNNTALATVDASTGVVTGVAAGTATISYIVSAGCYRTAPFTVKALPPAVATPVTVCVGGTVNIPPPSSNGLSWTSSNTSVATIGSASGVLAGISAGTTTLTYTTNTGCFVTTIATVGVAPAITGTTSLCSGSVSTLSTATTGGAWSSSNAAIASVISATGVVTGAGAGTATITYNTVGCSSTAIVSVSTLAAISGSPSMSLGGSATLSDATSGGTWSSSNTAIATVGASTGIVTGVAAGTATIIYSAASGCSRTIIATVSATSATIAGALSICPGSTTTLSAATSGGTWSGGNSAIATINASTGVVTGVGAGTINVSYTLAGVRTTAMLTVNPLPAVIAGTLNACVAQTATLIDATIGGAWSSNNTAIATIDPSTGEATGVTAGTVTMTYTLSTGCSRTGTFTVKALPPAIVTPIGACIGTTTAIAPPSTNGKSWSSSNSSVATIGSASGILTGVSTGTTTLTYTTTTGCFVTTEATVYPTPAAGTITGPSTLVLGNTITLNDAVGGGVWSSSNTARVTIGSADGIVTGVGGGTATISYSVSNPGCTVRATMVVHVTFSRPEGDGFTVSNFQLYPNPTTGAFTVEADESGTFSVFTIDGREVSTHNINTGINPLTLSNELASGIYMCRFTSESGNTTMVRLVYER